MQVDGLLTALCCSILLLVESAKPMTEICAKLQSLLSFGKHQTIQLPSNISYVPRHYTQNFLAYSPADDLLIFIEPKYRIYVYQAKTVSLIVTLPISNVLIGTSAISLVADHRYDLYFIYESPLTSNLITLRVCEVRFNTFLLNFENKTCIETLIIPYNRSDPRINGFAIKRDHAGTNKSFLFISTDIGLIHTIFETRTGLFIRSPMIMNDTLNEGTIVVSSSGTVYYANKQEHIIYELIINRDFRIRYGKIIKSNAIKSPYGLIADECNHLYIATKSMIFVMFVQTYSTIRTIFTRPSDMPITIERLNATTYAYATVKKSLSGQPTSWMFNFLSFIDAEKPTPTTSTSFSSAAVITSTELQVTDTATLSTDTESSYLETSTTMVTDVTTSSLSSLPDPTSSTSSDLFSEITTAPHDTSSFETSSLPLSFSTSLPMLDSTTMATAESSSVVPDITTAPDDTSSTSLPMIDSTTLTMAEPSSSVVPQTSTLDEQTSASTIVTEYLTSSATVSSPRSKPIRTRKITRRPRTTTVTTTRTYRTTLPALTEQSTSADLLDSTSLNLADLSLQTNQSLLLDITLPSSSNLTLANIQADRFVANIAGSSVNLRINEVETKEFALTVNLTTSNETPHRPSEVILGHVRSQHFQLTLVTTDGINVHVQRVDSDTAELIFDEEFCRTGSNVEINLNLSKSGMIRFGNRSPLRFGSVSSRVQVRKQSCDTDQPVVLFFDLCERENPCLNGGTCQSTPPNHNDPASSPAEISYQCLCPPDSSGEHCQYLRYPFGHCTNGGSLIETVDRHQRPIKVCACPTGFGGEHCEENINDCAGILCSKRGICQDAINNYKCVCFDGFYGDHCQETETETMLLQVVSKSFAAIAMLLIGSIAALFVASDIHTYLTRRKPQQEQQQRPTVLEHSVLLLDSNEATNEMDHVSPSETKRRKKCLPNHASMAYAQLFQSQSVNSIPTHSNPASLSFA